ncbi:hypothetical protein JRQ81_002499 [Phrynocephalus forsythii]|uniref:Uncharacterized protein n=1 Tax=Phrynocephalus forsythii TaxID=171643 RepID=A0A9Q1AW19_9SAUR|nr:hypothetical protein JRQ81_002499 [Phrynocephalus forsythii]
MKVSDANFRNSRINVTIRSCESIYAHFSYEIFPQDFDARSAASEREAISLQDSSRYCITVVISTTYFCGIIKHQETKLPFLYEFYCLPINPLVLKGMLQWRSVQRLK